MKYLLTIATIALFSAFTFPGEPSIHGFKVKSIEGYTPQYEALEKVYEQYKDKLVIVGFPANNFGAQEPGSDGEIQEFCKARFGVKFPLASKVSVKGDDTAPIYKWLTSKAENGVLDASISWNFNKFLLDENGKMLAYFPSKVKPDDEEILKYLK